MSTFGTTTQSILGGYVQYDTVWKDIWLQHLSAGPQNIP